MLHLTSCDIDMTRHDMIHVPSWMYRLCIRYLRPVNLLLLLFIIIYCIAKCHTVVIRNINFPPSLLLYHGTEHLLRMMSNFSIFQITNEDDCRFSLLHSSQGQPSPLLHLSRHKLLHRIVSRIVTTRNQPARCFAG